MNLRIIALGIVESLIECSLSHYLLHDKKILFILDEYPKHLFLMTLYQFNTSDEMEQLEAIWDHGVVVAERDDETYHYKLYQIDAFYVEEVWHKEYNVRRAFNSFASTDAEMLKPYLDGIDLKGLSK